MRPRYIAGVLECPWTGRFWATLLLRSIRMRSQQLGGASGVTIYKKQKNCHWWQPKPPQYNIHMSKVQCRSAVQFFHWLRHFLITTWLYTTFVRWAPIWAVGGLDVWRHGHNNQKKKKRSQSLLCQSSPCGGSKGLLRQSPSSLSSSLYAEGWEAD